MNLIIDTIQIEPGVCYTKWYLICDDKKEHDLIEKYKEEIKQEIELDLKEQYGDGGNTVTVY